MKAFWLFTILFLACGTACSQSLRVLPVQVAGGQGVPAAIQFFCTEKYSRKDCQNDISTLHQTLVHYPLAQLGTWSFVLASLDKWDRTAEHLHLPPASPAFSAPDAKMTVISQIIFSGPVDRRRDLFKTYQCLLITCLQVAISHELGHVICHELAEGKATAYGEQLRSGKLPACGSARKRRGRWPELATALAGVHPVAIPPAEGAASSAPSKKSRETPVESMD